jgi:ribonuclease-3
MPEGKLTDLRRSVVNMHALAEIARQLGIGEFLLLGKGEDAAGGRDKSSILADALEALIGAVYLDGGAPAAYEMVKRLLSDSVEEAIPHLEMFDAKTRLQELCARLSIGIPLYEVEGEGPDHERVFTAVVHVDGRSYGSGEGRTKKAAEQIAAVGAYDALVEQHNA